MSGVFSSDAIINLARALLNDVPGQPPDISIFSRRERVAMVAHVLRNLGLPARHLVRRLALEHEELINYVSAIEVDELVIGEKGELGWHATLMARTSWAGQNIYTREPEEVGPMDENTMMSHMLKVFEQCVGHRTQHVASHIIDQATPLVEQESVPRRL